MLIDIFYDFFNGLKFPFCILEGKIAAHGNENILSTISPISLLDHVDEINHFVSRVKSSKGFIRLKNVITIVIFSGEKASWETIITSKYMS